MVLLKLLCEFFEFQESLVFLEFFEFGLGLLMLCPLVAWVRRVPFGGATRPTLKILWVRATVFVARRDLVVSPFHVTVLRFSLELHGNQFFLPFFLPSEILNETSDFLKQGGSLWPPF